MLSNGSRIVSLRVGRVSTPLPANLMLRLHKLLLYERSVLWICLDGVGIQEFHECCDDLLVDLIEPVRFIGVHIIHAGLRCRAWSRRHRFSGGRVC